MGAFEYLSVLISIVLGLGITHLPGRVRGRHCPPILQPLRGKVRWGSTAGVPDSAYSARRRERATPRSLRVELHWASRPF